MPGVFDFVNDISHLKENIVENSDNPEETIRDYNAFLTNRTMSYFPDSLSYSMDMNLYHFLPLKMQYDYYFYGLRKKKRFSKQAKKINIDNLDVIQEVFNFNRNKALTALKILTPEQLETLKKEFDKGGTKK